MKLEVTKAWCLAAARREGDVEIGAGVTAFDPEPTTKSEAQGHEAVVELTQQIAFGRTVQLLRRRHRLTVEKLAHNARIDLGELVAIENDPHHRPEPRSVSQLAHTFNISPKAFQQLAGNTVIRDTRVREEAARFAARAGSIDRLTSEENEALEQFITALSGLTDNTGKPHP
jgi:HTH-type transcriptional regulator, competence development regulator